MTDKIMSNIRLTSKLNPNVNYIFTHEIKEVPRCHDNEVFTLIETIKTSEKELLRPLIEISSRRLGKLTILDENMKDDIAYYSDDTTKISLLNAMISSYEDQFYEDAPKPDCIEMQIKDKILEVIELITSI